MSIQRASFLFLFAVLCAARASADLSATVTFDIAPQTLSGALLKYSEQSRIQVTSPSELLEGRKSAGIKGAVRARNALERLLQGTDLKYEVVDENTVAIRPSAAKQTGPDGRPAAPAAVTSEARKADGALTMRVVQTEDTAPKQNAKADEPEASATSGKDTLTVTGSRIRGPLGEQTIQPVLTITREDIERYGVTSLGEVFRFIPQVSGFELGQKIQDPEKQFGPPSLDVTSNRVTATLRGAPLGGTLLLINGRRVPKNGQAGGFGGNDAYDLAGIPLSAIERIDVLLDGASALYGADAVGGVINVILRKEYTGTEARAGYENTFDSDVSVKTLALTHGFAAGHFSGLLTASWEDANSLMWADRWFLRSYDRRPYGGTDLRSPSVFAGRGVVTAASGNLPGLGRTTAAIPAGSTGTNLTVQDYANSGALPPVLDLGQYSRYSTPYQRKNISGNAEFRFNRAVAAFAEARWSENHTETTTLPFTAASTLVPAGAPGNPFGVPIRVRKLFFDLPVPRGESTMQTQGLTAGLRGSFLADWRYETAAHDVRTRPDLDRLVTSFNPTRVASAFASGTPPILLYDSTSGNSPNPAGTIESLAAPSVDAERSSTRLYDAQADGPLFGLPAGAVRASIGAEYRDEHVDFPTPQATLSIRAYERYTSGYFAELQVPLVSREQGIPLLDKLSVNLAVRRDRYNDFDAATSPRYGLIYRPVDWLTLRGSRGKGYKVPTLSQLYMPELAGGAFLPPFADAARGNEPVETPDEGLTVIFRGNPDLNPERSQTTTAGLVITAPFTTGLSISLDYYDNQYIDRVSNLAPEDLIVLFPDRILRGPNLPGDPAGWPGPVIGYEDVAVNIASNRISGYDVGLQYLLPTARGEWTLMANASKTTRNEIRSVRGRPQTESDRLSSADFNFPLQVVGSLFWTRGSVSTGVTGSYRAATYGDTVSGPTIGSAMRWDWQGSYEFESRGGGSALRRALEGTRISLTIFNLFDTVPPLDRYTFMPDNTTLDSRLRRYSLSLVRKF